jgi:hypothetical protein
LIFLIQKKMLPTDVVKLLLEFADDREAPALCDFFMYNSELYPIKSTVDLLKWSKKDGVPKKVYWSEFIKDYPANVEIVTKLDDLYRNPEIYEVELDRRAKITRFGIEYYKAGKRHRDDGPAILFPDGEMYYYKDDKKHRDDGPAIIRADGRKAYYKNGKIHRDDGPAVIYPNGTKEYYKDDKRHRDDGPAVIYPNGEMYYYKDGVLHSDDDSAVILADGRKAYYKNGHLHRDKGPAVIYQNGEMYYYKNGKRHRDDGSSYCNIL